MRKLWRWLTEPAPTVQKAEDRRRARLMAALLLVLIPLYLIPESILATSKVGIFVLPITLTLIVSYILSRTRHYRWGIYLALTAFTILPIANLLVQPGYDPDLLLHALIWMAPTLILGSLLLSPRGLAVLIAASAAAALSLLFLLPSSTFSHLVYPLGFLTVVSAYLLLASFVRQRDLEQIEAHARDLAATAEELRLFSRAVEQSASAIVITNRSGSIEYVNPAFTRITGYTASEILGQSPRILESGKHPPELYKEMWKTIRSGGVWQGEVVNRKKNGDLYWASVTISPVADETGQITHYLTVQDDITFRKEIERKLRRSEQRFRYLFEAAPDAVLVLNQERVITDCNQSAVQLYGRPIEEIIGRSITELMDPASIPFAQEKWQDVQQGQRAEGEIHILRGDGSIAIVWRRGTPLLNAEGEMEGVLIYDRDITRRKQAEEALAQAHEQALEANRLKTQLLANVSHDMRTPLGVILGRSEMLQQGVYGPLSERQRAALTDIITSTEQAMTFVNNLLGQAQIESGKIIFNIRAFSPARLLETAQSTARALAQAKGLELTTSIAPDIPARLQGDSYWLQQILTNLISNAIKFTDEGRVSIRIYRADEQHWAMEVSDTGCGISVEAQAYIFEPFRQVDGTVRRRQHACSGLGLSIVKELTTLMGGEIQLVSEIGKGSTFTVLLPLEPTEEADQ